MITKKELPQTAQVVADVIGRAATLALASMCENRHLYVPKRPLPFSHPIPLNIGMKATLLLQKIFGGELLPLAKCRDIWVEERNERIRNMFVMGKSRPRIAVEQGMPLRTVQHIISTHQSVQRGNHVMINSVRIVQGASQASKDKTVKAAYLSPPKGTCS